jgi:DNA-binding transcriptional LysR family regulator
MFLTQEGKIFYDYAVKIYSQYEEVTTIIQKFKDLNMGTLSVGAGSYFGSYVLPELLGIFKKNHPSIDIHVMVAFSNVIAKDVIMNNYELGFVGELDDIINHTQLKSAPFYEDELVLICSPDNPLSKKEEITIEDLRDVPFIKSDQSSALRILIEKRFKEMGFEIGNTMILNNIETIKRTVEQNLGISILPRLAVIREVSSGKLTMHYIKNLKLTRYLYYIHRNDKVLSFPAKRFLELTLDYFSKQK